MVEDYFYSIKASDYLAFQKKQEANERKIKQLVVALAIELQEYYQKLLPKTKEEAQVIFDEFLTNRFKVEVMKKCQALDVQPKDCFPLDRKWNNASFAAFLTYEQKTNDLVSLQKKLGLDLKGYYNWIVKKYEEFQNQSEVEDFEIYLFQ